MTLPRPHRNHARLLARALVNLKIRHLLHTGGLGFQSAVEEPTIDVVPLETAVRNCPLMPLDAEPGSRSCSSNAGINTAGRIVDLAGGGQTRP